MNNLEKACEIALQYFHDNYGDIWSISNILELKDKWIISQCNSKNPDIVYFGNQPVAIDKKTFIATHYVITEHIDELLDAIEIEVPNKFKNRIKPSNVGEYDAYEMINPNEITDVQKQRLVLQHQQYVKNKKIRKPIENIK